MADRNKQMRSFSSSSGGGAFILLIIALLTMSIGCDLADAQENAPCMQIKAACTQAGFRQGFAKDGSGLMIDCIRPIMQGVRQRPKATKPLPQVDAGLIAACKASNPNFGQRKSAPSQPSERDGLSRTGPAVSKNDAVETRAQTADVQRQVGTSSAARKRPNFVFVLPT